MTQGGPLEALGGQMIDPLIGQFVADRYEGIEQVGEGGMGIVYKARQEPIGRLVALKVLNRAAMASETAVGRFLNEAKVISQLRHPNTISLYDFGYLGDRLFIAMEYLEGGQLADLLDGNRLDQVAALRIAQQILKSLAEAHQMGIIHRDLKPQNVMFDRIYGEENFVRVLDFGLAKYLPELATGTTGSNAFGQVVLTVPGTRLGTPLYMAPEQAFMRNRTVDARSDLYSVGVLLYEMLTGHLPFRGGSAHGTCLAHLHESPPLLADIAPELSADTQIEALLFTLLAKDPDERPRTADEALGHIERILARIDPLGVVNMPAPLQIPVSARPVAEERSIDFLPPQNRHIGWMLAAAGFVLGVGAGVMAF